MGHDDRDTNWDTHEAVSHPTGAGAGAGAGAGVLPYQQQLSWRSQVRRVFVYLPHTWDVHSTFRVFGANEFMSSLSLVVFLYYTSIWAIVSTLMVYVTRQLHFDAVRVHTYIHTYIYLYARAWLSLSPTLTLFLPHAHT